MVRCLTIVALIVPALGSSSGTTASPYVQIVGLEESRTLGNGRLAEFLSSTDRRVALRAVLAIGRTKQSAGIPLLAHLTKDNDVAMRAMAVYAIGLIGGPPARAYALAALNDSADPVRISALDATDRLESAHAFSAAQERIAQRRAAALLQRGSSLVSARAATALQSFSGAAVGTAAERDLISASRNTDPYVRWHVIWALFRGYAKDTPLAVFFHALDDPDETVRIQAVRGVGRHGDRAALVALRARLSDPSWRVREQALESIAVLQGGSMTEHLASIPSQVQTPAPVADRYAGLPALARSGAQGKPVRPATSAIITQPALWPQTAQLLTGPAAGPHPRVRIVTTQGNVYAELYPEWAPLTVENFLNLSDRGYYDNNRWFRIVPDFVVQTGDPNGNGNGDAGYTIPAEENPIEQDAYVLSMGLNYTNPPNAHAIRDSAGTQFYITLSPQLHLDRDFTVFGKVISGFDVLGRLVESDKIVRVERIADTSE
ncbi:MAG TPA: peptidylprolyl isomerase [Candidatus Baltobacteraceae bacterium]|nr:peptidylprolyl isomerase [Candidatus Baltobacteraceae bacterium]